MFEKTENKQKKRPGLAQFKKKTFHYLIDNLDDERLPKDLRSLATHLDNWKCRSRTATGCLKDLGQELLERGTLSDSNVEVIGYDIHIFVTSIQLNYSSSFDPNNTVSWIPGITFDLFSEIWYPSSFKCYQSRP